MTHEAINRATILFSFFIGLLSSLLALTTGGDLVFVIVERFFVVVAISAFLIWIALTTINSIIVGAARDSISRLREELEEKTGDKPGGGLSVAEMPMKATEDAQSKGQNLDLTSEPQESLLDTGMTAENEKLPEIKEFEPFKPKRIETDKDNSNQ